MRMAQTTRTLDWPTYPLQTPSGGGLAPTPNRSTTRRNGRLASGEMTLDNSRPVTEAHVSPSATIEQRKVPDFP
jgi:hypothetical protein